MDVINIEGKDDTPQVKVDVLNGKIEISGKSLPEDAKGFYDPILRLVNGFYNLSIPTIEVDFKYKYFNTASSKMILEILRALDKSRQNGKEIIVNWYYKEEDDDLRDEGTYFSEIMKMPFNYIEL